MSSVTPPELPSRRAVLRNQTVSEIKAAAFEELAARGGADLSLRSVARALRMSPSALYRYFPSRDDLITVLVSDGFDSLGAALEAAEAEATGRGERGIDRWITVAQAHRRWALDHASEYSLVYGRPIPGYDAPKEQMLAVVRRGVDVMFGVMIAAVGEASVDLSRFSHLLTPELSSMLHLWRTEWHIDLPEPALAMCLHAWTQLHGFIVLEMHGHLPPHVTDVDALFRLQMAAAIDHRPPGISPK